MKEWTGKEIDNIITMIAQIGMQGKEGLLDRIRPDLEKCTAEIEEIMSAKWFNEEMMKEWKKKKRPDMEAIK